MASGGYDFIFERALGFKRDGVADGIYKIEGAGPLIGRGRGIAMAYSTLPDRRRGMMRLAICTCTASSFWFNVVVLDLDQYLVCM